MSASPLEALQRRFVRSITFLADPEFVAAVTGGGKLTAAEAVDVYRGGYPARLTEALGETFEACWRVLGDEDFFAAARDYIARMPSLPHNLSDYGEDFPEFLESRPGRGARAVPRRPGALRMDVQGFVSREAARGSRTPPFSRRRRGRTAVLRFGGAVRLLSLRHRVYGIWKRDRSDDTPLEPADWTGAERLILYKKEGNAIFTRELTAPEHAALTALAAGRPLADALAGADGLDAAGAQALFAFVSESGIVAEVAMISDPSDLGRRARRPPVPLRAVAHPRRARGRGPGAGRL